MMKDNYIAQVQLISSIREFFNAKGFLDVITPPVVENPGMEVHIHPFQLVSARNKKILDLYLHTSPEFWMKKLLSEGLEKIFTLTYCFRDEPLSEIHRSQFIMLEWYRTDEFYTKIMDDCLELFNFCHQQLKQNNVPTISWPKKLTAQRMTIQELFKKYLEIDILDYLEIRSIKDLIQRKFKDVPLPIEDCSWSDYFFLIFLNKLEPELRKYPFLILYNYPAQLAALSTINIEDPRVCDRFELYSYGIEIANCFNELTDFQQQKNRFNQQAQEKGSIYNYQLPEPYHFYSTLNKGIPKSAGVALGVERLLLILTHNRYGFWDS